MDRRKGQNLVEYALMLGLVVGLGFGFYTGGAGGQARESIRSVFSHADTLLSEAADRGRFSPLSPGEVIHKLREGRFSGLSKELMRKCYNRSKPLCIPSYSEEGRKIADDLGIRIPHGDAWFVHIYYAGTFEATYYSAEANQGMTYEALREDYFKRPGRYYRPEYSPSERYPHKVVITDGIFYPKEISERHEDHWVDFGRREGRVSTERANKGDISIFL